MFSFIEIQILEAQVCLKNKTLTSASRFIYILYYIYYIRIMIATLVYDRVYTQLFYNYCSHSDARPIFCA